jgi:hypothetical protein
MHDIPLSRSLRFRLTHELRLRVDAIACFFVPPKLTPQTQDCMLAYFHETPDHPARSNLCSIHVERFWGLGFAEVS